MRGNHFSIWTKKKHGGSCRTKLYSTPLTTAVMGPDTTRTAIYQETSKCRPRSALMRRAVTKRRTRHPRIYITLELSNKDTDL